MARQSLPGRFAFAVETAPNEQGQAPDLDLSSYCPCRKSVTVSGEGLGEPGEPSGGIVISNTRGGTPLNASPNDLALIAVMRRYFLVKDETNALKQRLEAARKDADEEIDRFYDPRLNAPHADDILAWHPNCAEFCHR